MNKRIIYNLDSCTIIEILRSNPTVVNNMLKAVGTKNKIAICSVAYYEVMRGYDRDVNRKKVEVFNALCNDAERFNLDDKAIDIATDIYRYLSKRGQKIEDDDIFIAAITLANNATLITDNVKHFERVPNLNVVNWKDLGED
ncbi:MAG: PIN domain-containing protein [Selenomonadaceae bacterium]|nr:PIN domain-containing protein [Selenomonadaceae bacterium]